MGMADYESLIFSLLELRDRMSGTFSFILCLGLLSFLSRTNERTILSEYHARRYDMSLHLWERGTARGEERFTMSFFRELFLL
jgi:hypothetical protein